MARRRAIKKPNLGLEIEFQLCRGIMKHQWDWWNPPATDRRRIQWGFRIGKLCTRCGTTAVTAVNHLGAKESWEYKYPDGYSLPKDEVPTQEQLNLSIISHYDDIEYFGERELTPAKPAKKKTAVKAKRATPRKKTGTRKSHLRAVS